MDELNSQFRSVNSPLSKSNLVSGYDFDINNERDAVNSMHIKNFSFSQGTGGTLTLSAGMSVVNASGTAIIDQYGLTSTSSFTPVYKNITDGNTVGTSNVIIGTIGTLTLQRETSIFFTMRGYLADKETITETTISATTGEATLWIKYGTSASVPCILNGGGYRLWSDGGTALNTGYDQVNDTSISKVPAGTHEVRVLAHQSSGGTALWVNVYAGYSNLGV